VAFPFLVGAQSIGELSLNDPHFLQNAAPEGDQAKQALLFGAYFVAAGLLLINTRPRYWFYMGAPLLGLTLWCFASIGWSLDAGLSWRRCVALIGTIAVGLYLGLRYNFDAMMRLLLSLGGIILTFSLILAVISPSLGLDPEGRLRGVSVHKNALASFAALILLVCLSQLTVRRYAIALPLGGVALLCLFLAHSASVIPVLAVAVCVLLIAWAMRWCDHGLRALLPLVICGFSGAAFWALSNIDKFAESVGRDPDISGRTIVWDFIVPMIFANPYFGYGFGAFWFGKNSPGETFWANTNLGAPHAHNGFLQLALDGGAIGLGLFILALLFTVLKLIWLLPNTKQSMIPWALAFAAFDVMANMSETWLWQGNEFLVCLFVYVVVRTNITLHQTVAIRKLVTTSRWESEL
jgi:exopolysaccharide production protein ExoQ